jgi:pilus assembly protein CpaC
MRPTGVEPDGVGGTQQVMLKVRFAEMQRGVEEPVVLAGRDGNTVGGDPASSAAGPGRTTTCAGGLRTVASPANNAGGAMLGFNAGGLELGVLLEALESKGVVRTLAEPNLTALSGQEAKFLAGGEYPMPVAQDSTVTSNTSPSVSS